MAVPSCAGDVVVDGAMSAAVVFNDCAHYLCSEMYGNGSDGPEGIADLPGLPVTDRTEYT